MMRIKYLTPEVLAKKFLTDEVVEQCSTCLEYIDECCRFHQMLITPEEAEQQYCGGWYTTRSNF